MAAWGRTVAAACGLVLLVGCSAFQSDPDAGLFDAAPNVLRVGVTSDAPPVVYKERGEIVGLEADLARGLAEEMGMEVEFVELDWTDLIPALEDGRIDIIMSGMSITQVRRFRVAFCQPYMRAGLMALVRTAAARQSSGPIGFATADETVAVQEGTTGDYCVRRYMKRAERKAYATVTECYDALRKGKVDLLVHDAPVVWRLAADEPAAGFVPAPTNLTVEYYAWAVLRDDGTLLLAANSVLTKWLLDGTLLRWTLRWVPAVPGWPD